MLEEVSYLKGLLAGLDFEKGSKQERVFTAMVEAMEQMSTYIDVLIQNEDDIYDMLEILSDDLSAVEDELSEQQRALLKQHRSGKKERHGKHGRKHGHSHEHGHGGGCCSGKGHGEHGHHHHEHNEDEDDDIFDGAYYDGNDDFLEDEISFFDDETLDPDTPVYEVVCPNCSEVIYLDDQLLSEGQVTCPSCKEYLEFDPEDVLEDDFDETTEEIKADNEDTETFAEFE